MKTVTLDLKRVSRSWYSVNSSTLGPGLCVTRLEQYFGRLPARIRLVISDAETPSALRVQRDAARPQFLNITTPRGRPQFLNITTPRGRRTHAEFVFSGILREARKRGVDTAKPMWVQVYDRRDFE